uniref:Uncharacterized protein n=1 Tax=Spongospora subterranea TaxID=70186 RepID=A0A0H5QQT8_9EUKA|eukprot:CRZ04450.1 hypothetical protein [Spongospora subterranea]
MDPTGSMLLRAESETAHIRHQMVDGQSRLELLNQQIQTERDQLRRYRTEKQEVQAKDTEVQEETFKIEEQCQILRHKREKLSSSLRSVSAVIFASKEASVTEFQELQKQRQVFISDMDTMNDQVESVLSSSNNESDINGGSLDIPETQTDFAGIENQLQQVRKSQSLLVSQVANAKSLKQSLEAEKTQLQSQSMEEEPNAEYEEVLRFIGTDGVGMSKVAELETIAKELDQVKCTMCNEVPDIDGVAFTAHVRASALQLESMLNRVNAISLEALRNIVNQFSKKMNNEKS